VNYCGRSAPIDGAAAIGREALVKLNELAEIVSKQAKMDEVSVRKTLKATMTYLKEQIDKEERLMVPGLGSFIRKAGKEPGISRILFRPVKEKEPEDV
jgi:hypothetical protein